MPRQGIKNRKSTFGTVTPLRGRYWARFTDETGKRRSAGTFPTERAAWNRLEAIRRGERVPEPGSARTFGELARMVAEARTELADGTRRNNASMLRTTLAEFASKRADKITIHDVDRWWSAHRDHPVQRRNSYFLMSSVYRHAIRWQWITTSSPCQVDRAGADASKARPSFSHADFRAVVVRLDDEAARAAWVLFGAHLRIGELAGLNWDDWNPSTAMLLVARQVTGNGSLSEHTKTSTTKVIKVLVPAAVALHEQAEAHPGTGAQPIFAGVLAERLRPRHFRDQWAAAAVAAGLPGFHVHDVRHTSLSAVAPGAAIAELMRRGGHRTARAALRYQTATAERDAQIADAASRRLADEA